MCYFVVNVSFYAFPHKNVSSREKAWVNRYQSRRNKGKKIGGVLPEELISISHNNWNHGIKMVLIKAF